MFHGAAAGQPLSTCEFDRCSTHVGVRSLPWPGIRHSERGSGMSGGGAWRMATGQQRTHHRGDVQSPPICEEEQLCRVRSSYAG
jgi:hypothetical protein